MRLIDADELIKKAWDADTRVGYVQVVDVSDIEEAPTIETEPVKCGEWILGYVEPGYFTPGGNRPWICSECGEIKTFRIEKPNDRYCSYCGTKMDGE